MLDLILLLYKRGGEKAENNVLISLIYFIKRKECVNDERAMGPAKDRKKSSSNVNSSVAIDVNEWLQLECADSRGGREDPCGTLRTTFSKER